jgi:hypothetical protein
MSTTAFVARRIGEKDPEGAAESAVQAIALGVIVSVVFGVIGVIAGPQLLSVMGASAAVIANARYTQLMLGGFLLFLINAIFRGAGDAALAMRTLWLANAINILLDPCLINGWGPFPRLGVVMPPRRSLLRLGLRDRIRSRSRAWQDCTADRRYSEGTAPLRRLFPGWRWCSRDCRPLLAI